MGKNAISYDIENCYSSPGFDSFFLFDSSQWELSGICQWIFSYLTVFKKKRGQNKRETIIFPWLGILFFILCWLGFSQIIRYEQKGNKSCENKGGQNDHLSSHITVSRTVPCSAHYCFQHIGSSKILCPNLHKFVHFSDVNMLQSYHAELAQHHSFK